ncbi:MAG: CoA transferase [Firmicutes bacterium]|nr:CoA transferase [Bacillota bacterium]
MMLNGGCMYDYYETKDGKYMSVGSLEPQFWRNFCLALGREDLIDGTVFPENVAEVKAQIRGIFKTKTRDEWTAVFTEYDACVQPVLDLKEALLEDEQVKDRQMVVEVEMPLHPGVKVKQMATSVKLSECPCEYEFAGYPTGHHTREIIEKLGLDYEELEEKGVFR